VNTDSSGTAVGEQGSYPFGEFWYSSDTTTKWRFTSYERDAESGNDYAMFRYYSNRLGRFLTPDPLAGSIANPQSLNRYGYVTNDPVNLIDPLGLDCYWWVEWERLISSNGEVGPKKIKSARLLGCDPEIRHLLPIDLAQWDDLHLRLDRLARLVAKTLKELGEEVKAAVCSAAPEGRVTGVGGNVGAIGAPGGTAQVLVNYNTGEVSASASGNLAVGPNGGAQAQAFAGFVYNLGSSNSNFSGDFAGGHLSAGPLGLFGAQSPNGTTAAGVTAGGNLLKWPVSFSGFAGHTSDQIPLGEVTDVWNLLTIPGVADLALYQLQQVCRGE
jgi:RHS repeat-associated protein